MAKRMPARGELKDAANPQENPKDAKSDCVATDRIQTPQPIKVAMAVQT